MGSLPLVIFCSLNLFLINLIQTFYFNSKNKTGLLQLHPTTI